ncbi:MAG: NUDIX hydrolase [Paracoccaceae bacterium]|nr:NUDIX hydrolase [Paracoccaceae bacterium]
MPKQLSTFASNLGRDAVYSYKSRTVYHGFFSVEEHDLSFSKFDGSKSEVVTRSALISSDAVIILPYDPVHDRVLLVEQFRTGPYVKGDRAPWCLEPIAGLIDSNETPEQAGLREAQEEAKLTLLHLELVARSYPSPGISTEFFHQYIGITSLPEKTDLVSGLASEAEDIRSHIFSFPDFLRMIETGQISVGPAILLGFWLATHRDRLRKIYSGLER